MYRTISRAVAVLTLLLATATAAHARAYVIVDSPRANATVPSSFVIGGWAVDMAATTDSGVSMMHVWAYPATGAAPFFLGQITRGARADVAAYFGKPQFINSGFSIIVSNLKAGGYTIVIYPFSSITNAFDYSAAVALPLTVKASTTTTTSTPTAPTTTPTSPTPSPSSPTDPSTSTTSLRVLQWNTHHGGFGTDGVYSPDRLATWAANFNPDVVMFNEIEKNTGWGNQDQPEVYKALLQQKTGRTWYYVFAQEFGNWSANGKGNLILSRYPINVKERYELVHNADRSLAMATITVNNRDITLICTHLDPYDQSLRLTQATEVTTWAAAQPENRIITGDMNAWPDQTAIAQFNSVYNDSWTVAANNGTATAFSGNSGETRSGRIDYIFYSKGASSLLVKSSQVFDTRDASGVMPSDHRPVLTVFSVR